MSVARSALVLVLALSLPGRVLALPVVPVDAGVPRTDVLAQVEALEPGDITTILNEALASIGCALPADLLVVFEFYLVDHAMTALGTPIGPELARQGFFGVRQRAAFIDHAEADAILAMARALDGRASAAMRSGELVLSHGMWQATECTPTGTIFALEHYVLP